jgi:hypothetical protein
VTARGHRPWAAADLLPRNVPSSYGFGLERACLVLRPVKVVERSLDRRAPQQRSLVCWLVGRFAAEAAVDAQPLRVVVVDDDEIVRTLVRFLFRSQSHRHRYR